MEDFLVFDDMIGGPRLQKANSVPSLAKKSKYFYFYLKGLSDLAAGGVVQGTAK